VINLFAIGAARLICPRKVNALISSRTPFAAPYSNSFSGTFWHSRLKVVESTMKFFDHRLANPVVYYFSFLGCITR